MDMPQIVAALTGQSGCGKSTVALYYRQQGYTVLDCDKIAAGVLAENDICLQELAACFGQDILDENGALQRRLLADKAFGMPDGQRKLSQITHPYIIAELLQELHLAAQRGERLAFVDGAVIVGEQFESYCNRIVVVDAPQEMQVLRLCERDGITRQQALLRLNAQQPKKILLDAADEVIVNDGSVKQLLQQAQEVLKRLEKDSI